MSENYFTKEVRYKLVKHPSNRSCFVPEGSKYSLEYQPSTTVTAPKDTLGIMVFETRQNAMYFQQYLPVQKTKIIEVRVIGDKRKLPSGLASFSFKSARRATAMIKTFNRALFKIKDQNKSKVMLRELMAQSTKYDDVSVNPIPAGTECYAAVRVCGQIKQ
jgi:hypothetical protein